MNRMELCFGLSRNSLFRLAQETPTKFLQIGQTANYGCFGWVIRSPTTVKIFLELQDFGAAEVTPSSEEEMPIEALLVQAAYLSSLGLGCHLLKAFDFHLFLHMRKSRVCRGCHAFPRLSILNLSYRLHEFNIKVVFLSSAFEVFAIVCVW